MSKFVYKFKDLVSKITFHKDTKEEIAKAFLNGVKSEPKIIYKNKRHRSWQKRKYDGIYA